MVPNFTDNKEAMKKFVGIIKPYKDKIERVEILPYHLMGVDKYKELGKEYPLKGVPAMSRDKAFMLENYVRMKLGRLNLSVKLKFLFFYKIYILFNCKLYYF